MTRQQLVLGEERLVARDELLDMENEEMRDLERGRNAAFLAPVNGREWEGRSIE